jgi:hypothetical protein
LMWTLPMPNKHNQRTKTKLGFRSILEERIALALKAAKVSFTYEETVINYTKPVTYHRYTPDFILPNGIIVEAKGLFDAEDRKKHLYVKEQHPSLDIRFVFSNSRGKLYKGSKTTYGMWVEKNGFIYADKLIPKEWINE